MGQRQTYPTTERNSVIDIDKCKQAFAASTLCQKDYFTPGTDLNPDMLCAVSALTSFAGVCNTLIGKMCAGPDRSTAWRRFHAFAAPILEVEYGISRHLTDRIPGLFDKQENEWRAVQAVLDLFEQSNKEEEERVKRPITATQWNTTWVDMYAHMDFTSMDFAWPKVSKSTFLDWGIAGIVDAPSSSLSVKGGDVLGAITSHLGAEKVGVLEVVKKSGGLITDLAPPDTQILATAKHLRYADKVALVPQIIGSPTEWVKVIQGGKT